MDNPRVQKQKVMALVSFTPKGRELAERIKGMLKEPVNGELWQVQTDHKPKPLKEWCRKWFQEADALLFIGALGIAVRTIAPFLQGKTMDPAVLAADEKGMHIISVLSGHLGGGNELAIALSGLLFADPVITTASDVNKKLAVDVFAKRNNLYITSMAAAREAAAAIVAEKTVELECAGKIYGAVPPELAMPGHRPDYALGQLNGDKRPAVPPGESRDCKRPDYRICISPYQKEDVLKNCLWLVPKAFVLGIGCKRGKTCEQIESRVLEELEKYGISVRSIKAGATVHLKKDEAGLLDFFQKYRIPLYFYTPAQLQEAPGVYPASEFVKKITGVDNVCERAAVLRSIEEQKESKAIETKERIALEKSGKDGITLALARLDWSVEFE